MLVTASLNAQKRPVTDMKTLETQYCNNFDSFLQQYPSDNPSSPVSYDASKFQRFAEALTTFDTVSLPAVEETKVLSGLTREDVRQLGWNHVKMQRDASHWLNYSLRRQSVHVVSLNWSRTLIRSSLDSTSTSGGSGGYNHTSSTKPLLVHANELEFVEEDGERGLSTGNLVRSVVGANDKIRVIKRVTEDASMTKEEGSIEKGLSSPQDLLCILETPYKIYQRCLLWM